MPVFNNVRELEDWDYFDFGDILVLGTVNIVVVAASSRLQIQQKCELEGPCLLCTG